MNRLGMVDVGAGRVGAMLAPPWTGQAGPYTVDRKPVVSVYSSAMSASWKRCTAPRVISGGSA